MPSRRAILTDVAVELGNIAIFQVDHVAGNLQQGRGVGGGVVAAVRDAEQQRRAFAGDNDPAGLAVVDDCDGVGADQLPAGDLHRLEEVGFSFEAGLDQVSDAFGVGVGGEDVAAGTQVGAQAFVVFDDAVVDDGDRAGDMRVGVAFAGYAMGGPAGVGDAGDGLGVCRGMFEFGNATDGTHAFDLSRSDDRNASRVVAPVFEPLQSFNENGNDVAASCCRDNAAHGFSLDLVVTAIPGDELVNAFLNAGGRDEADPVVEQVGVGIGGRDIAVL